MPTSYSKHAMTKILFIGAQLSGNFGGPSLLSSTIKVLSNFIPKTEFTFLSPAPTDVRFNKTYGIKIVPYTRNSLLWCLLGAILNLGSLNFFRLSNEILNEYKRADIVIDIWGLLSGELVLFFIAKLLNKPIIKFTADVGPFRTKRERFYTRFYLNNIELILARSEITKKHLLELGITTPIFVCPDTAFLLESIPCRKDDILFREKLKKKTLVGISTSHVVDRKDLSRGNYISMMAKIADYLIQKLNAFVILIPNEIFPNKYDDVYVAKRIHRKINEKAKVMLLTEEYPASELKWIIAQCDLLIGARYHSIVAATSMLIPTLAISWHHKYREVMKLIGQEEYVCDIERLNFAELREKIDNLWKNKEKIKAEMAFRIPFVKESVLSGGKVVKEILKAKKRRRKLSLVIPFI